MGALAGEVSNTHRRGCALENPHRYSVTGLAKIANAVWKFKRYCRPNTLSLKGLVVTGVLGEVVSRRGGFSRGRK